MHRSKIFWGAGFVAIAAIAAVFSVQWGLDKVRYFQTIIFTNQYRVAEIGQAVGADLALYQRSRGDARLGSPDVASPFATLGEWKLIGGNGANGGWGIETHRTRSFATFGGGRLFVGSVTAAISASPLSTHRPRCKTIVPLPQGSSQ
jgi:hypothetical protein